MAQLCRIAIDFGKHGKRYVKSKELYKYKVKLEEGFPDFMEKRDQESYRSDGVLGELYRDVKGVELEAIRNFI